MLIWFAACGGGETSRVIKWLDYIQGPGVLSGERYNTLVLCWADQIPLWIHSHIIRLVFLFIRGQRRTGSRIMNIFFIFWGIYWVCIKKIQPGSQKYPSTECLAFWGASFSSFSHLDKWTKIDNLVSTMEQEMFNYPYYSQWISAFLCLQKHTAKASFVSSFLFKKKFPTLHRLGRDAFWGRLNRGFLPSSVQYNAIQCDFYFCVIKYLSSHGLMRHQIYICTGETRA